jgi:hypothetical protein
MERGKLAVYRPPSAQGPGRVSANRFVKPEVIVPGPAFQRKIVRGAMGPCTLIDLTSRFQLGQRSNAVSTSRTACEEATISISLAPTTGACELISAGAAAARILLAKVSHFCISFEESDRVLDPRGARSGGRCDSSKLDIGDADPRRSPTGDRRSCLACLFLGLE